MTVLNGVHYRCSKSPLLHTSVQMPRAARLRTSGMRESRADHIPRGIITIRQKT